MDRCQQVHTAIPRHQSCRGFCPGRKSGPLPDSPESAPEAEKLCRRQGQADQAPYTVSQAVKARENGGIKDQSDPDTPCPGGCQEITGAEPWVLFPERTESQDHKDCSNGREDVIQTPEI